MSQPARCAFCSIESTEIHADTLTTLPTPALDRLLRSNTPPTHGMETSVKIRLARVQDRLKTVDESIHNLQEACSLLKQEEANLMSVISPVRRVPPEILSEIFILHSESWWESLTEWQLRGAMPTDENMGWTDFENVEERDSGIDEETQNEKLDRDLTDLALRPTSVLSRICRSWRAAALACSSLWSNISLHPDYCLPAAQVLLGEQLRLSASRPLRIHTSYKISCHHYLFPLLQDILPTSHRWTSVHLIIDEPDHPLFPQHTTSPPFPLLVSLSLILKRPDWYTEDVEDTDYVYKITSADAPLLREVSLSWPDGAAAPIDLPWAQLRKLRFWGHDGAHALGIIDCLWDIEELDLLGLCQYDDLLGSLLPRSLPLPSLRCLRLSNVGCLDSGTPGMILPYLQVPSLQSLYWTGLKHAEMKELYTMVAPQVAGYSGGTGDQGQQVLRHLHLYNPRRDALETLGCPYGKLWSILLDAIGPQLESFTIEYPTSSGVNATLVLESLINRIKANKLPRFHACTLQGVHVSSSSLADLISCVESHKCDIRVRNCTLNTQEALGSASLMRLRDSFPKDIPEGAFFELDVEAPNHGKLFYGESFGAGLEESCENTLRGMSFRQGNGGSVLDVV